MTLADRDSNGALDFEEFQERMLTAYQEMGMSRAEVLEHMAQQTNQALDERARMGPRYHAGIRFSLRRIFALVDLANDGLVPPENWVSAQKTVATQVGDDLQAGWIDE
ncbi:unnamed protein product, partial [Symbiodinium microadriaticum]